MHTGKEPFKADQIFLHGVGLEWSKGMLQSRENIPTVLCPPTDRNTQQFDGRQVDRLFRTSQQVKVNLFTTEHRMAEKSLLNYGKLCEQESISLLHSPDRIMLI